MFYVNELEQKGKAVEDTVEGVEDNVQEKEEEEKYEYKGTAWKETKEMGNGR